MAEHFRRVCLWWEGDALEQRHFSELPLFATDHASLQSHVCLELSVDSSNSGPAAGRGDKTQPRHRLRQALGAQLCCSGRGEARASFAVTNPGIAAQLRHKSVILFLSLYTKNEADSEADI